MCGEILHLELDELLEAGQRAPVLDVRLGSNAIREPPQAGTFADERLRRVTAVGGVGYLNRAIVAVHMVKLIKHLGDFILQAAAAA